VARIPITLKTIEIKNLRGFAHLKLDFAPANGPYVVIGKNGTCKTTLLRALAAVLGIERGGSQFLARAGTLARFDKPVMLDAHLMFDGLPRQFGMILKGDKPKFSLGTFEFGQVAFVCAYGVSRFFSGPDSSASSGYAFEDATATLFNVPKPLTEPELTVRRLVDRLDAPSFGAMWKSLERLIGLAEGQSIEVVSGGGLKIHGPNNEQHDFHSWADGHRITFTWILDFFAQAMKADAFDAEGNICGVLLVDEIEQHLHPSMQLDILPKLQALLPKCQIIVTTHSPLVALSVASDHVISLQRQADGSIARVPTPDLTGYSAEDVLVHPNLFDAPAETRETENAREIFKAAIVSASRSEQRIGVPGLTSQDAFGVASVTTSNPRHNPNALGLASLSLSKPSRNRLAEVDPELDAALKEVLAAAKASSL